MTVTRYFDLRYVPVYLGKWDAPSLGEITEIAMGEIVFHHEREKNVALDRLLHDVPGVDFFGNLEASD